MRYSKKIKDKLVKHDIHLGQYLGGGSYGTAYELEDQPNKVIKITQDGTEANAMNIIKNHPQKNIVNVDRVFKFKDTSGIYFIIQEKLEKLDQKDENFFFSSLNEIIKKYNLKSKINVDELEKDGNTILRRKYKVLDFLSMDSFFIKFYKKEIPEKHKDSEIMKFLDALINSNIKPGSNTARDLLRAYWQLKSVGIKFQDVHTGNIMKKGNIYKLIDLGVSRSPKQSLDVLERRLYGYSNKR